MSPVVLVPHGLQCFLLSKITVYIFSWTR